MKKTLKRLLVAALLSLSVYGATMWWYKNSETRVGDTEQQKPVAFIQSLENEAERRQTTRLIWQMLDEGDPVFTGESIRTSELGEVRIQFADGGNYIDLEPDSLIVISGNGKEISLDLAEGSLQVNKGDGEADSSAPKLLLNSDQGKIDLTKASAQLSKADGKGLELQVLEGSAKVNDNGQTKDFSPLKTSSNIEILSPSLDKPHLFNPEKPEPVVFRWKGFPENAVVTLWTGKTRKAMSQWTETVTKSPTELQATLPPGKQFWKLVVMDPATQTPVQESGIYRIEVGHRFPPALTYPEFNGSVAAKNIEFRWSLPNQVDGIFLEIAKDQGLRDKVFSQNVGRVASFSHALPEGKYFWRASAIYKGLSYGIPAKALPFAVTAEEKKAQPPVVYQWDTSNEPNGIQFYDEEKPSARWSWTAADRGRVKTWKISVRSPASETPAVTLETTETSVTTQLNGPGTYVASIEGLDDSGAVISQGKEHQLEIKPRPLLESPDFISQDPILKANNQGRLDLVWNEVNGAKEYNITLYAEDGKEKRKAKFSKTSTSLLNLLPGKYKVGVTAVDAAGKESTAKEPRVVEVPDNSALKAPKLKKIKVN